MSVAKILGILFFFFLACALAGGLFMVGVQMVMGMNPQNWQDAINETATVTQRNWARFFALINNASTFLLPAILCAYIAAEKQWANMLSITVKPSSKNVLYGIMIMLVSVPLIQYTYSINKALPMPEWMIEAEKTTEVFIKGLLKTEYSYEFWFNLLLFALIPAIGEEAFFRGILQKQLTRLYREPHLAIWVTAIIFSTIHFQFAGFVPRLLLGGVLGYVFYFSRSLWASIIGHFTNNALMIIAAHWYQTGKISIDIDSEVMPWWAGLISLGLTLVFLYLFEKENPDVSIEEEEYE